MEQEMEQENEGAPAQGGGDKIQQDLMMVGEVLAKVSSALQQKNPPLAERMSGVLQEYQSILQELMSGGGAPPPAGPKPGGMGQVPMEAGANGVPVR